MCFSACCKRRSLCDRLRVTQFILGGRIAMDVDISVIPSFGGSRFRRPRNGPPSWTEQYFEIAATAIFRRSHSASKDLDTGHVNNFSRR